MSDSILIVDAGGTSTNWCRCSADDASEFVTGGINAAVSCPEEIQAEVSRAGHMLRDVRAIYFYGAGCATALQKKRISSELYRFAAPEVQVRVESDLVAAGRALFGSGTGVACILGTGSNCGLAYRGDIVGNVPPLGYILGDEGGGAHMGKEFLKRLLRRQITDQTVIDYLNESVGMDYAALIERIYHTPSPNRFLASLAPTLHKFKDLSEIQNIIDYCLQQFFSNCVSRFTDAGVKDIGFIGSLAKAFEDNLRSLCDEIGLNCVAIEASPLSGLKKYHIAQIYGHEE